MKVRFGEFVLDGGRRQLSGPAGELRLSPKAFDLLAMLVEHRSRAVAKSELQERLWPDTFVLESNLAGLITEIREALHDPAKHPRFIRTAHRFGYAFCGPVVEVDDTQPPADAATLCWLLQDGSRIPLQPGENILGREGTVPIDALSVSRRHARITVDRHGAVIDDLGSKNGTYVRGERISQGVMLTDGDEIHIGSLLLLFRQHSGAGSTMTLAPDR